jgi:biopolymer transport protein ExbB/TolQ
MRKVLIILFFVAVIGLIAFFLIQNPEVFKKIYLWLIGLFGIITWPFRKLWSWMNGKDELNEIEQNNKILKQELEQIKKDLALAQKKLEEERSRNKIRMEELVKKINQEDQTGKAIAQELQDLKNMTDVEFKDSLKPEERRKIQEDIWKEVDFGL